LGFEQLLAQFKVIRSPEPFIKLLRYKPRLSPILNYWKRGKCVAKSPREFGRSQYSKLAVDAPGNRGTIPLSDLDEGEMDLVIELLESILREHIER
jgi:hypothetical protein